MTKFIAKHRKVAAAIITVATAIGISGALTALPQVASAITVAELQAQIAALTAQLNQLVAQSGGTPATGNCGFTRALTVGSKGDDVTCLQNYLTSTGHFTFSGGATGFFGAVTKAAVAAWQAANGVSPAAGYFGTISQAKYNSMVAGGGTPTTPGTPGVPPVSGGVLQVTKATQPGDNLAPGSATRIPVTAFTLTAGSADVTVRSITAERIGLATDAAVDKVLLLGPDGLQIGRNKTLGSNHRSILDESFTIKAGESKTYTIAFNRPSTANEAGNVLSFDVVAIDASASVTGTLPIRGAQITMNSTLTIGSVDLTRGVNDPGVAATSSKRSIGDTGYKFAGLRLTAGAAEDLMVRSVAWYQAGSVAASDMANVKIVLGDTEFPATLSSDGKYYTAKFGDGVLLGKGNQVELYIKGDIVGGTSREVEFQLFRDTDLDVVGKQFGFGVKPGGGTATAGTVANGGLSSDIEPAYRGFTVGIGSGTVTVSKSTDTLGAAQNIPVNLDRQILGAFDVDVKGEAVTYSSMVFRVSANANDSSVSEVDYSNVGLYNASGSVIAGPKDGSGTTDTQMVFTFTDAVEFPIGKTTYFLKGKLSTDFDNNTQVSASTTPSSDWSSGVGRVSGVTVTPGNVGTISGNSMTVRTSALTVSIGNTPTAQTVIRGTTGFTFANVILDGTASGEDIRLSSGNVQLNGADGNEVKNCQLWDGTTSITTGSNTVNPTSEGDQAFTFDSALTVTKGTNKTLALKCDTVAGGDAGQVMWTFSGSESFGATGLTSGNSLTPTVASSSVANIMTFSGSGTLAVALDGSSPSLRLAQAGQDATLLSLRFTATNEAMDLRQISFRFSNIASNTPSDLVMLTLWDGATKVGEISATSSNSGLTTSVNGFLVPKNGDKVMTVKGMLAPIGVSEAGRPGHRLTVDYDQVNDAGVSTTYAVGQGSSQIVRVTSADTASNGIIAVRTYPTVSVLSVPTTSFADASQKVLYRYSVAAPAGGNGVSLYKFTFGVATVGDDVTPADFSVTNLRLFCFTSSGFSGGCYSTDGQLNNGATFASSDGNNDGIETDRATTTDYAIYFNPASQTNGDAEAVSIPAGSTYYFELRGDVSGADSGDTMTVNLQGDNAWFLVSTTSPETTTFNRSDTVAESGVYTDTGFTAGDANTYSFATSAPRLDEGTGVSTCTVAAPCVRAGKNVGATGVNSDDNQVGDDFIWSANSTTTHTGAAGDSGPDWYNGFAIPGLPATGAQSVTFSL